MKVELGLIALIGSACTPDADTVGTGDFALSGNLLVNPSFESPVLAYPSWVASPAGATWAFSGTTGVRGISTNASAFTAQTVSTTDGVQVGFIQGEGTISQSVSVSAPGVYVLSVRAIERYENQDQQGGDTLSLSIDGTEHAIGYVSRTAYTAYATTITLNATTHSIAIVGHDPSGGDNTIFVDTASLTLQTAYSEPTQFNALVAPMSSNGGFYAEFAGDSTTNTWYFEARHMGDYYDPGQTNPCPETANEVATTLTWDPGIFTGFHPALSHDRGGYNLGSPSYTNGFQIKGADAGSWINTWGFTHSTPVNGGGRNTVLAYNLATAKQVWVGGNSQLVLKASVETPYFAITNENGPNCPYLNGCRAEYSMGATLYDNRNHRTFQLLGNVWRGGAPFWQAVLDGETDPAASSVYVPMISSLQTAADGKSYGHNAPASSQGQGAIWSGLRPFQLEVSAAEMVNITTDLGHGFSTDPTDYRLTGVFMLHEAFPGQDTTTVTCAPLGDPNVTKASTQLTSGVHVSGFGVYQGY